MRSSSLIRGAGVISLAAGCLALAAALERAGERLRLSAAPAGISPGVLMAHGLNLRKTMADLKWLEALQHTADYEYIQDGCSRLYELVDRGTDLDPAFLEMYSFGGAMLMWQCRQPRNAAALLRKGIAENPGHHRFKLYLAAFSYHESAQLADETAILETLAFAPGAPAMLRRILANLYVKMGDNERAAALCRAIMEFSRDAGEIRWAAGLLGRLER